MVAIFSLASSHPIFAIAAALTLVVVSGTWILAARPLKPISPEEAAKLRGADDAAKNRLWEHALHEDNFFNDRLNFFLVFESVSFGVIGALFTHEPSDDTILRLLALFGLLVSLLWVYIQARNKNLLDIINERDVVALPLYPFTLNHWRWWPFSATWVLAYILPFLVLVMWLLLLGMFDGVLLVS